MKRCTLLFLLLSSVAALGCANCAGKRYAPNEGPVRLECKAQSHFANVGDGWEWGCMVNGDLSAYQDSTIGIEVKAKGREEYPYRSIVGTGLKRFYGYTTELDEEYYRELTGNYVPGLGDRNTEVIERDDTRYPQESAAGIENELDGSFYFEVYLWELTENPDNPLEYIPKLIAQGKVRGKLGCNKCSV